MNHLFGHRHTNNLHFCWHSIHSLNLCLFCCKSIIATCLWLIFGTTSAPGPEIWEASGYRIRTILHSRFYRKNFFLAAITFRETRNIIFNSIVLIYHQFCLHIYKKRSKVTENERKWKAFIDPCFFPGGKWVMISHLENPFKHRVLIKFPYQESSFACRKFMGFITFGSTVNTELCFGGRHLPPTYEGSKAFPATIGTNYILRYPFPTEFDFKLWSLYS